MSARSFKRFFIGFFVLAVVFSVIGLFQAAVFPGTANAASGGVDEMPCWPHEKSDLYPDPALVFGKLSNGFRYVLMENHEPKARVSMHLNIQTGSMNESDYEQGLAHFLEHMLFNGSTHFKPGELVKYFQNIGMESDTKFGLKLIVPAAINGKVRRDVVPNSLSANDNLFVSLLSKFWM